MISNNIILPPHKSEYIFISPTLLLIFSNKMSSDSKVKDLHRELFEVGLKNRREVVGDVYVNKALENGSSEFAFPGQELVTE